MKRIVLICAVILMGSIALLTCGQAEKPEGEVRLIIRADDIGSFHAANVGCMMSYTDGIMRSVEVMVPCPWYPEAVQMMNKEPELDVGIHLVLTSEWEAMKWRPLTGFSSITDESGYFFPMVWPNDNYPPEKTFRESGWILADVEKELRAQIELAIRDIPAVSHITSHMGFTSADPSIDSLVRALAKEYELYIDPDDYDVKRFRVARSKEVDIDQWTDAFIESLDTLQAGTYLFVEHPALDTPEMETIGHAGSYQVGEKRQGVTDMFVSEKIKKAIRRLDIELISYADLKD